MAAAPPPTASPARLAPPRPRPRHRFPAPARRLPMRLLVSTLALCTFVAALAPPARAEEWHRSLEDGLAASAKSGKPTLLVTLWKEKV